MGEYIIVYTIRNIIHVCGIYFIWVGLHYVSSHAYVNLCVPYTVKGFFMSPIQSPMPHCVALRYMIYTGGEYINKMWWILGVWLCYTFRHHRIQFTT